MNIAIYATAHGYGHASRAHEVARSLVEKDGEVSVHFCSSVADGFFSGEDHPCIIRRGRKLDVGIHQIDSLTMNIAGTLDDLDQLSGDTDTLIQEEAVFLQKNRIDIVLADLPHLAFEAAAKAGVPAWGLSNFSWDWIYEAYVGDFPDLGIHIELIRRAYEKALGLFRLPFHGDMGAFRNIVDVPLVARSSKLGKGEGRKRLGLMRDQRIILFSFGGIRLTLPIRAASRENNILLCSDPSPDFGPPFMHISNKKREVLNLRYCDLVAAADVVVSKPGYGIVSECIANRTALLYTARGHFREYPILVEEMVNYLPVTEIQVGDFQSERWWEAVEILLEQPFPAATDCRGADRIADLLISQIES